MRTLIDANLMVSFLLNPHSKSATTDMVHRILTGNLSVLISQQSIAELVDVTQRKPYLRDRISQREVIALLKSITATSTIVPPLTGPVPQYGRDHKDDYLIHTAIIERASIIVSGDKDLLVLDPIGELRIVPAAIFMAFIDASTT